MSHEDISLSEQEEIRREKLAQLNEMGVNPYPYSFDVTHTSQGIKLDSDLVRDEESNPGSEIVSIAGRIMTRRIMPMSRFSPIVSAKKNDSSANKDNSSMFSKSLLRDFKDEFGDFI